MKVGFALVVVIALAGCGSTKVEPALPSTEVAPPQLVLEGPTLSPDPTPVVTSCSRLLAEGWEPARFNDFDVSTSRTSEIAEFSIGNDRLFLDIRNDLACQRLPVLGPIIAGFLGDSAQPTVTEDLRGIAELFIAYARSSDPDQYGPPADTPVDLYVGGVLRRVIPSTRLGERDQWQACPGGIGYAGRTCPISALTPFVEDPGPIAITSEKPAHPCMHSTELPESLGVYRTVTLTPEADRDCSSYFAVQLFVNDVHQIVAVNVVMSEP